jgi:energy-coupling factor transporter transmembrane protein EcfT
MMKDITLGQYFPGNSLLHRMDPRMKLVLTLSFIVLVFLPQNWWALLAAGLFLLLIVGLSRLPVRLLWRSTKPVLFLVLFTAVLNVLQAGPGRARGRGAARVQCVSASCILATRAASRACAGARRPASGRRSFDHGGARAC